eukprot:TRINITY_DN20490_c0_g1_i1.p1 TRINITY_DN20490_c0_g1~~TRINITY_DN20490_c0_g1_i1.p1  ORF type:complete len:534 (-),score=107.75 TRINITY_DN20490_c0_g1_i1:355-1956(-)
MAEGSSVVVKNTFLEIGDHPSLLQRSDKWRRQMSEPTRTACGQDSDFEELDDPERNGIAPNIAPAAATSMMPASSSCFSSTGGQNPGADFSAPPPFMWGSEEEPALPAELRAPAQRDQGNRGQKGPSGKGGKGTKNNDVTCKEPPWADVTTVMMRNIPNKYRQQMLLDELQDAGFRMQTDFDFFYLPMDHSNAANLGYAFINFCDPALANAFASAFSGKKMRRFNSHKTVMVMPASIQGYERNYRYYSSTRVAQADDPAYRPLFLKHMPLPLMQEGKGGGGGGGRGGAGGVEKGGRGAEKGSSKSKKSGAKSGKMASHGKGVEAFSQLAFMGFDQAPVSMPGAASLRASDWPASEHPWPMQGPTHQQHQQHRQQQQQLPHPTSGAGHIYCMHCGNPCEIGHRFCSGCGNVVQTRDSPGPGGAGACPGKGWQGPCGMRPEAQPFMPMPGPQGPGSASACLGQRPPMSSQRQYDMSGEEQDGISDSVSNELDVMRGRLMLIAALKDIEQRDSHGSRGDSLPADHGYGSMGNLPHW